MNCKALLNIAIEIALYKCCIIIIIIIIILDQLCNQILPIIHQN